MSKKKSMPQKDGSGRGSPQAVLKAMRELPNLQPGDVDELERMIESGKLPVRSRGIFDSETDG